MKKIVKIILFCLVIIAGFAAVDFVFAQAPDLGLNYGSSLGLSNTDPRIAVANIVRLALTFVGIIAIIIILYGGYLWMSSAGNAEKIAKAKKVLISAVIGLIIILAAFLIVSFAINYISRSLTRCSPTSTRICGCNGMGNQVCQADETWGICAPDCNYGAGEKCFGACGCCPAGQTCCGWGCAASCAVPPEFHINSTWPLDGSTNQIRNTRIIFRFNLNVDNTTVNNTTFTVTDSGGPIAGTRTVNGRAIEFVPNAACPPNPCGATHCFAAGDNITVTVVNGAGGILSVGGINLSCPGSGLSCTVSFSVGNRIDCQNPVVSLDFTQVCVAPNNNLYVFSSDDSAVDRIEFFVDGSSVPNIPFGNNPVVNAPPGTPFNTRALGQPCVWDASSYSAGMPVEIKATAYDIDAHSASDSRTVTLRPAHCCNGEFDDVGDPDLGGGIPEKGADCGGDCAACEGAACGNSLSDDCMATVGVDCSANNDRCASWFCDCTSDASACAAAGYVSGVNNCCLCQSAPIIDWITPIGGFCSSTPNTYCGSDNSICSALVPGDVCNLTTANGAPGNLVTIGGRFFGDWVAGASRVDFSGIAAVLASTTNPACDGSWTDNQIIVVMPAGVPPNPFIRVTAASGYSDTTQDARGPTVDFTVNTISRPGICQITPDYGVMNDTINYDGINLPNLPNGDARFGNLVSFVSGVNYVFINNRQITVDVPDMAAGQTSTYIADNGVGSNYLLFRKDSEAPRGPYITSFEPTAGNIGQYVTIYGHGFGNSRGTSKVYFGDQITGTEADYSFPAICANSVWRDNRVIVKVPTMANGNYPLTMAIGSWVIDTGGLSPNVFNVDNTLSLAPSLCRIQPVIGPNNSPVSLWGEYFGAAPGLVRFHLNHDQGAANISFWGIDGDAQRIDTVVHPLAVSGPVRVVQGGLAGNSLNFRVGECAADADCGAGNVCCPTGSYQQGRCVAEGTSKKYDNCFLDIESSVYEWDFSTGSSTSPSPSATASSCVEMSREAGQCRPSFCPNSPGQCSPYAGGSPQIVGGCSDSDCDGVGACTAGLCTYNSDLNRCVNGSACDFPRHDVVDVFGHNLTAYCAMYSGNPRWHVNTSASCPSGPPTNANTWSSIGGGRCIEDGTVCTLCAGGFACLDNAGSGVCAVNREICPLGSTCNAGNCERSDSAVCECCCEIGQDARDCCTPLTCEGTCGSDTTDDGSGFGHCSGCANAGITQAEHDAACNCEGSNGKYCDTTDPAYPAGVCRDCAQIGDKATECSVHTTCCFDAKGGKNLCRAGNWFTGAGGINYCAYYDCQPPPNEDQCDSTNPVTDGTYGSIPDCTSGCAAGVSNQLGRSCAFKATTTDCQIDICPSFQCLQEDGSPAVPPAISGDPDSCGICCCDPNAPIDQCTTPELSGLNCTPDKSPCTGNFRGLCCGCEEDDDCVPLPPAGIIGCGSDSCCRARPNVASTTPADEATNICRNALITVEFDELMDLGSFSGNVIVVGDYGADPCPEGTQYLAKNKSLWQKIYYKILSLAGKAISPILPAYLVQAYWPPAAASNYCAITGMVSGSNNAAGHSVLEFKPSHLLDGDRVYYTIVKGDANLNSSSGVLSAWEIGFNGGMDETFNGITYRHSHIFSFRTLPEQGENNGVCVLDHIDVAPVSYLFKTVDNDPYESDNNPLDKSFDSVKDSDKVFIAYPRGMNGQILAPVPGEYDWSWSWNSSNPTVAQIISVTGLETNKSLVRTGSSTMEGHSVITARATIVTDNYLVPSTAGQVIAGDADVYVFICENPWPPENLSTGTWHPWRDSVEGMSCLGGTGPCHNTNYEIYYCRDAGRAGTFDDLPAILSDSTIIRGQGTDIFKEAYFFRESVPTATSTFTVVDAATGGAVIVSWGAVADPAIVGYNLYWGRTSGSYNHNYHGIGYYSPYTITGLTDGTVYYFNITSYYDTGAESDFWGEVTVTPTDSTPPLAPTGLAASAGDSEVQLSWNASADASSYQVYYGTSAGGPYGYSNNIGSSTAVIIAGLTNGQTYYFVLTAKDKAGNESGYSAEVNATP